MNVIFRHDFKTPAGTKIILWRDKRPQTGDIVILKDLFPIFGFKRYRVENDTLYPIR